MARQDFGNGPTELLEAGRDGVRGVVEPARIVTSTEMLRTDADLRAQIGDDSVGVELLGRDLGAAMGVAVRGIDRGVTVCLPSSTLLDVASEIAEHGHGPKGPSGRGRVPREPTSRRRRRPRSVLRCRGGSPSRGRPGRQEFPGESS